MTKNSTDGAMQRSANESAREGVTELAAEVSLTELRFGPPFVLRPTWNSLPARWRRRADWNAVRISVPTEPAHIHDLSVPILLPSTKQRRPSTKQRRPSTKQRRPSTKQRRPSTKQRR